MQLVRSGLFPCSPIYPTVAIDIRVLDFVRRLFLRIAPNYTAWCSATIDFLAGQGYHLPGDDPLRRRFANALQWFISLYDMAAKEVDTILQRVREEMVPDSSTIPSRLRPQTHCNDARSAPSNEDVTQNRPGDTIENIDADENAQESWKRGREESDEASTDEGEHNVQDQEFHSLLSRPTEYLRSRCVACFGGKWYVLGFIIIFLFSSHYIPHSEDVVLNIDACYTQKHCSKGGRDPPRTHPNTFFIPEAEVKAWKRYVHMIRPPRKQPTEPPRKQRKAEDEAEDHDRFENGLRVPKSVLDGCLASFTAADETRVKGSTRYFDVTANMTLLCRHDRPLFSVNIDTAGEGQHFVFALLAKVFEHLPQNVEVRFLYDIGCQLHRSCEIWGFLKPYLTRLTFAVSIFHAFGHQWPCQLVYHPRKCIGYGLSDGEGAERLWHALSHLIAYGRVAGVSLFCTIYTTYFTDHC